jgi:hypothetical protein
MDPVYHEYVALYPKEDILGNTREKELISYWFQAGKNKQQKS